MRETLNSLSPILESSAGKMLQQDLLLQAYDSYGGNVENEYLIFLTSLAHVVIHLPKIDLPNQPRKQINIVAKVIENLIPPNADPLNTLVSLSTPPLPFPHYLPEKIEYFFAIFNDPPLKTLLETFKLRLIFCTLVYNLATTNQIQNTFRFLVEEYIKKDDPLLRLPPLETQRRIGILAEALAYAAFRTAYPSREIYPTSPLADKLGIDLWMDGTPISVKASSSSKPPYVKATTFKAKLPDPDKSKPFLLELPLVEGIYVRISPLNINHLTSLIRKLKASF